MSTPSNEKFVYLTKIRINIINSSSYTAENTNLFISKVDTKKGWGWVVQRFSQFSFHQAYPKRPPPIRCYRFLFRM